MGDKQRPAGLAAGYPPDGERVGSFSPRSDTPCTIGGMLTVRRIDADELRWYHVHVDSGPGVQPWTLAIEGSSPADVRSHLERDFAAKGVTATIGEIGLLDALP